MASMALPALPASLPGGLASPFQAVPDPQSARSSPAHSRRHSRTRSAAPLPAFSFNPGATSEPSEDASIPQIRRSEQAMEPQASPRRAPRPPPLPAFTFNPGAEMQTDNAPSPTHPILEEMALNQQRVSRSARPAPLPSFTFSPGAASLQRTPSPTKTTFAEGSGPLRAGGHRRGISEFVGGADGSQLVSTSPQKHETRPHGPPVAAFPPRGHAHRRSQAVSISEIDTSDLIKANAISKHRAGSTPSTPSEPVPPSSGPSSPQRQPVANTVPSPASFHRRRGSAPGVRPRVGFSDHVDVIPRPLSLISSETSGSSSTVRGNHSLSGSINSIATSPTPQPPPSSTIVNFDYESPHRRPRTADAAHTLSRSANVSTDPISLPKRPLSASGSPAFTPSGSPPTKKKFWFSHSAESSPSPTPRSELMDPFSSASAFSPTPQYEPVRPKTSPERTLSLRKRKAKTWTSGIFSRKSRHRPTKSKGKRTPTPPMIQRRTSDQMNEIFDADDTIVIRDPSPVDRRLSAPVQSHINTAIASTPSGEVSNRVTSPIIDLDAALGPFGSEEKFTPDHGSRTAASRIAKLHSSERRGVTDAFGLHRRAESAPQMPPVNRGIFGVHRLGSNTSLVQDVFDEQEEDEFLAEEHEDDKISAAPSEPEGSPNMAPVEKSSEDVTPAGTPQGTSSTGDGLGLSIDTSAQDSVVILDSDNEARFDATRASNSTIAAPVMNGDDLPKRPASSPMDLAYPAPQLHYASSTECRTATNSLISSPDADHISFDHQPRFNRYLGEPSPEIALRASNDDLPSLTDSISTGAVPRFSSSANTRSSVEQRSASVSGPVTTKSGHAWKRASLASLNRLIPGSSNGSRLKFEATPDPSEDEKVKKKGHRISKLMHFWRSKEKTEK